MLNFKPDVGELVESSDDLDGLNAPDLVASDDETDSEDSDDDTDQEDIADVGEEAGMSQTQENPFFDGSDDSDMNSDSMDDSDEDDEKPKEPEVDEEDDLIKALKAARQKKERVCPPDIKTSDLITDISFHPDAEIIAVGNISGDLSVFKYSNEENSLQKKLKVSKKTIRGLEYNDSGSSLLTISKDKTFRILDVETWSVRYVQNIFVEYLF